MRNKRDAARVVGIVLLCLFVLVVAGPLLLTALGITFGLAGALVWMAVGLIKLAVVAAIIYLVLVGLRAILR